ncbi:MAG: alpha/beta fold hydrolase [Myxococcales bacterium]
MWLRPVKFELEVLERRPAAPNGRPPLLFVHGAFMTAACWTRFLDAFAERGYPSFAVSLRGHGGSEGRAWLPWARLADFVEDVRSVARRLGPSTVLVGHSMGGMVVQKLLEAEPAPAAVLMASVPPSGLWGSALSMLLREPGLWLQLAVASGLGPRFASATALRRALFSPEVSDEVLKPLFEQAQTESQGVLADLYWADLPIVSRVARTPLLVLGASNDCFVPSLEVQRTARTYGADCQVIPNMSHAMMLEPGWAAVVDRIDAWLCLHGASVRPPAQAPAKPEGLLVTH